MSGDSFPTFLRTWLSDRKLSAGDAAPILGVSDVCIYNYLNGDYKPTLTKAPTLAPIFGIDEDVLRAMLKRPKHRRR